jgi:hypothetical protein
MTVDTTITFQPGDLLETEQEIQYVKSVSGVTVTVARAQLGSADVEHASGVAVLRRPKYYSMDILELVNDCIRSHLYPWFYIKEEDESKTTVHDTFEYATPANTKKVTYVQQIEPDGKTWSKPTGNFTITEDVPPKIRLWWNPPTGRTLRIVCMKNFTALATLAANTDLPDEALQLPSLYAASVFASTKEVERGTFDRLSGVIGERAVRELSNIKTGTQLWKRFIEARSDARMPYPIQFTKKRRP